MQCDHAELNIRFGRPGEDLACVTCDAAYRSPHPPRCPWACFNEGGERVRSVQHSAEREVALAVCDSGADARREHGRARVRRQLEIVVTRAARRQRLVSVVAVRKVLSHDRDLRRELCRRCDGGPRSDRSSSVHAREGERARSRARASANPPSGRRDEPVRKSKKSRRADVSKPTIVSTSQRTCSDDASKPCLASTCARIVASDQSSDAASPPTSARSSAAEKARSASRETASATPARSARSAGATESTRKWRATSARYLGNARARAR